MTPALPDSFRRIPIAHRGLHDRAAGRIENSPAAFRAAVEGGWGIELDVQLSADGEAMVFHDYDLERLTGREGMVREHPADVLTALVLTGGEDRIPTLPQVLDLVRGRVPLLVEVKDQDGGLGPDVGSLEQAVARAVEGYDGDLALMSFNPHSVAALAELCPDVPRGLTTEAFRPGDWPVPETRLSELSAIADYDRVGASFISHGHRDLSSPRVAGLKAQGAAILCWTIRSTDEETAARRIADNVTFEGYLPERAT
ncbi:phosphodiesterase [Silicimonas algicola]|uniref:Glycerophosphoryl diester phosphodiesterase n=1 Tax=Silicimonas algicola TaxID=1826607 RepID=A0A316G4Q4_9RHOB|nr:glycerophosphodiester phosphodiesterase family protein [Silicimonas algicola]AZQ68606.1 phosphodiesterase [Silicimonas algicola]PWK55673.1 glycerophosphoryl diester phosphodiesterase [Silicimonas algicola]